MNLTDTQRRILELLVAAVAGRDDRTVAFVTEWLGYLPYGAYQWVEGARGDLSEGFPEGWSQADLEALTGAGALRRVSRWQSPDDPHDSRTVYEVLGTS